MNFSKYTTKELKFITSNVELLKKELEKRHIKELNDFPFKVGDVIHTKHDNDNFLLKIKKIDKINNNIVVDEIVIRDGGLFETYYEDWQHFSDWNFDDMGESIIINYSYLDYNDNWEYNSIEISLDKVIEMI